MKNKKSLEESIIDLYLHIKKENILEEYDQIKLKKEKEKLKKLSSLKILDNIKSSFEIVSDLKAKNQIEVFINQSDFFISKDLEEILRNAENKIRNLYRVKIRMRIINENLMRRVEELEKLNEDLKKNLRLKEEVVDEKKELEIKILQKEIDNQKLIIGSYENMNSKLSELEVKLRSQNVIHEKELKNMDTKYKQKIFELNDTISKYEEIIKSTKASNANVNSSLLNQVNPNTVKTNDPNISTSTITASSIPNENSNTQKNSQKILTVNQNSAAKSPTYYKEKEIEVPNTKFNANAPSTNLLRNSFSNSINKNSSYIEEEEEISHLNFENRRYSKESTSQSNENVMNENIKSIEKIKITRSNLVNKNIPRSNKDLTETQKSKTISTKSSLSNVDKKSKANKESNSRYDKHNKNVKENIQLEEIANDVMSEIGDSNDKQGDKLLIFQTNNQPLTPKSIQTPLNRNVMMQSAEYNLSSIYNQFIFNKDENVKNYNLTLSHAYSQRNFNNSFLKGRLQNDNRDNNDTRTFAYEEPNNITRSNSSKKLIEYDINNVDRLKGTFYKRNQILSPNSLSSARLNRSIKKSYKINQKEYPSYSNLHEIQENLERMKSPKPKPRANPSLKLKNKISL